MSLDLVWYAINMQWNHMQWNIHYCFQTNLTIFSIKLQLQLYCILHIIQIFKEWPLENLLMKSSSTVMVCTQIGSVWTARHQLDFEQNIISEIGLGHFFSKILTNVTLRSPKRARHWIFVCELWVYYNFEFIVVYHMQCHIMLSWIMIKPAWAFLF